MTRDERNGRARRESLRALRALAFDVVAGLASPRTYCCAGCGLGLAMRAGDVPKPGIRCIDCSPGRYATVQG